MATNKIIGVITPSRRDMGIWKRKVGIKKYKGQNVKFIRISEKADLGGTVLNEVEEGINNHLVSSLVRHEAYSRIRREYKPIVEERRPLPRRIGVYVVRKLMQAFN